MDKEDMHTFSLEERFTDLCTSLGHTNPKFVFDKIYKFHTRNTRYHHNLELIRRNLEEFSTARHLSLYPISTELSLFFKDLIFEHYMHDNKPRSAQFAFNHLKGFGVKKEIAYYIYDIIVAVDPKHRYLDDPRFSPISIDQTLVADIDTSPLGLPPEEYDLYESNIKKEYMSGVHRKISEEHYVVSRLCYLRDFLANPKIFLTDFFRIKYKKQARENIERRVRELMIQLKQGK